MKLQLKRRWHLLFAAVLLVVSCDLSTFAANQQIPTPIPGAFKLIVAQTAGAAATQTAALIPVTLTPSVTPFPTLIPSVTPTATQTFVFLVASPTPIGTLRGYSCNLVSQNPKDGTDMNGKTAFTVKWKVINDGGIAWDPTVVDFVFASGTNFSTVNEEKIPTGVGVGESVPLSVDLIAPNKAGRYITVWSLRAGVTSFCSLSLSIKVN
jgi:Ig-like domain from next to BRCA1 gene